VVQPKKGFFITTDAVMVRNLCPLKPAVSAV